MALLASLIIVNVTQYRSVVSAEKISSITSGNSEVSSYLESQKAASPHFVTIATLVKQEQQRRIIETALLAFLPISLFSMLLGLFISRALLRPVVDSYETQSRFIQDAAHELRNPLAALSATVEAAELKKSPNKTDYSSLLFRLKRQLTRLIAINEDLVFLQKTAEAFNGSTEIVSVTKQVINDLSEKSQAKGIAIDFSSPASLEAKIRSKDYQIVAKNLIDNAIKYSHNKTKIEVGLQRSKTGIELKVDDRA